jgi:AmiR/NasT family two-component response regulator
VLALFAFPMFMGAATVGVVGLSSKKTGALDASQLATAARLTRGITRQSVRWALAEARDDLTAEVPAAPAMRREVHQATGMILAQLGVSATEAFARLRAHAFATSRTVEEVARSVVTLELDFRDLSH